MSGGVGFLVVANELHKLLHSSLFKDTHEWGTDSLESTSLRERMCTSISLEGTLAILPSR